MVSILLKIEMILIQIVYIIHNEEQQLQRSALPHDEGKEGSASSTNDPEA